MLTTLGVFSSAFGGLLGRLVFGRLLGNSDARLGLFSYRFGVCLFPDVRDKFGPVCFSTQYASQDVFEVRVRVQVVSDRTPDDLGAIGTPIQGPNVKLNWVSLNSRILNSRFHLALPFLMAAKSKTNYCFLDGLFFLCNLIVSEFGSALRRTR